MNLPPRLRLALVPIGIAIASKGLSYLSDEADRLAAEVDARRAALAEPSEPGPEDLPAATSSRARLEQLHGRKTSGRRAARLLLHVAAFGAGAYLGLRAGAGLAQRAAAAELAAAAQAAAEPHPCHDCGKPLDPAVTFPGPRCLDCHVGPEE